MNEYDNPGEATGLNRRRKMGCGGCRRCYCMPTPVDRLPFFLVLGVGQFHKGAMIS